MRGPPRAQQAPTAYLFRRVLVGNSFGKVRKHQVRELVGELAVGTE
jgi:hypothetical protein